MQINEMCEKQGRLYSAKRSSMGATKLIALSGRITVVRLLTVVLVLGILIALTATIHVIASPKEREHFSEFYIPGENRMVAEYPDLIITGQNYPMFIGVGNHEYRNMNYTIEM